MPDAHTIQRCRWAEPTLFLVSPLWMAADDYPWSCWREDPPRVVEDTAACKTCLRWEQDGQDRRTSGISRD
jgi:hypothetical protein